MGVPFDHIANSYDAYFTNSAIGQLQRKRVWSYVEQIIPELAGTEILELNCGTGEDALLFGEKGFNILATDISEEMLKVASKKASQFSMQHRISSHYLDLNDFDESLFQKKFDLIFSNFGGLNCINQQSLKSLFEKLPFILNPNGRFIGVVMPKLCLWESFYFLTKFKFKSAFRRLSDKAIVADLHGGSVSTWYYSPQQIRNLTQKNFKIHHIQPVGLLLPPSYLEDFFKTKNKFLNTLHRLESKSIFDRPFWAKMSDHFLIDLKVV